MVRRKISLARSIHCCPSVYNPFVRPAVYFVKNMDIYIHVSECLEVVHELPLPPNNAVIERFLHNILIR